LINSWCCCFFVFLETKSQRAREAERGKGGAFAPGSGRSSEAAGPDLPFAALGRLCCSFVGPLFILHFDPSLPFARDELGRR
jgi:hypothetical protein